MTSLYTRTGDTGQTSTFGGPRVSKTHPLVEAYGTVDELNTSLGLARLALADSPDLRDPVTRVQNELFTVGADLATPPGPSATHVTRVPGRWASVLESEIDRWQAALPPLRAFVLPAGTPGSAALHFSRAVCRRAERASVAAIEAGQELNPAVITYLNRLSDWLFAAARMANHLAGEPDEVWHPPDAE